MYRIETKDNVKENADKKMRKLKQNKKEKNINDELNATAPANSLDTGETQPVETDVDYWRNKYLREKEMRKNEQKNQGRTIERVNTPFEARYYRERYRNSEDRSSSGGSDESSSDHSRDYDRRRRRRSSRDIIQR